MRVFVMIAFLWTALPLRVEASACTDDEALSEAAALLALAGPPLTPEKLVAALREAGSDLVAVRAAVFPADVSDEGESWLATVRARAEGAIVCGEARGATGRVLLAAARGGRLHVDADPRALHVTLASGFSEPELLVRDRDGAHHRFPVEGERVELPTHVTLPALVQLVARGPSGPRPIAERAVGGASGRPPVAQVVVEEADLVLGERIGALRGLHDARPLRPNRLLANEAAAHAERVCKEGKVGHELSGGETPDVRLARRGLRARVVGETVSRATDTSAALSAMATSPSHLVTLVDRRFTDAGWGVAADAEGQSCLVVLLAAWPRMIPSGLPKASAATK